MQASHVEKVFLGITACVWICMKTRILSKVIDHQKSLDVKQLMLHLGQMALC